MLTSQGQASLPQAVFAVAACLAVVSCSDSQALVPSFIFLQSGHALAVISHPIDQSRCVVLA